MRVVSLHKQSYLATSSAIDSPPSRQEALDYDALDGVSVCALTVGVSLITCMGMSKAAMFNERSQQRIDLRHWRRARVFDVVILSTCDYLAYRLPECDSYSCVSEVIQSK